MNPNPQLPNDPTAWNAQIAKARQDLRKAENSLDRWEMLGERLHEKAEMQAAFLRLLLSIR